MHNVLAMKLFYSNLRLIIDHLFQWVSYGQKIKIKKQNIIETLG